MDCNIRQSKLDDKDKILDFIRANWNENHIFIKDNEVFDYLYYDYKDKLNFIIAEDEDTIIAVLGFIKYQKNEERNQTDVFLALWKSYKNTMAGIKCLEFLISRQYKSISCCGINFKTLSIYKFLGYKTGKLNQWYMLNENINDKDFKIANIKNSNKLHCKGDKKLCLINDITNEVNFENINKGSFNKGYDYLENKYIKNPYYLYDIYGIREGKDIRALVITREIEVNNSKCVRVIDFIGEDKYLEGVDFKDIIHEKNYEYIDFYEVGLSEEILRNCGLVLREDNDKNIIPNYFEPFEKRNVEIYYMTNYKESFYMFKGDGDQDRPSIVRDGKK